MHDSLDDSLTVMMQNLATVLVAAGIPGEQALRSFSEALDQAPTEPPERTPDFGLGSDASLFFGAIITTWRRDSDYVDNEGEPIPLPLSGADISVEALYERVCSVHADIAAGRTFDESLQRLTSHNVVQQGDDGMFRLVADYFRVNQEGSTSAVNQLDYISRFVSTSAYNVLNSGPQGRFQRAANVRNFPVSQLPVLNRMVREHGMDLLTRIDSFLEESADAAPDNRRSLAGVGVYMYVND